jgi:hypothetical protein
MPASHQRLRILPPLSPNGGQPLLSLLTLLFHDPSNLIGSIAYRHRRVTVSHPSANRILKPPRMTQILKPLSTSWIGRRIEIRLGHHRIRAQHRCRNRCVHRTVEIPNAASLTTVANQLQPCIMQTLE